MNDTMNITETPDSWVIVKMVDKDDNTWYKVFASWLEDRWRMNSGIVDIQEDDSYYYFIGDSGSCYKCHKNGYGFATGYASDIAQNIISNSYKVDIMTSIMDSDTDWNQIIIKQK